MPPHIGIYEREGKYILFDFVVFSKIVEGRKKRAKLDVIMQHTSWKSPYDLKRSETYDLGQFKGNLPM